MTRSLLILLLLGVLSCPMVVSSQPTTKRPPDLGLPLTEKTKPLATYFEHELPRGLIETKGLGTTREGLDYYTYNDKDGHRVAEQLYTRDGRLAARTLVNAAGKKEGPIRTWFPNGQLRSVTPYHDGLRSGHCLEWDDQGNVIADYQMTDGTGVETLYFPDGGVMEVNPYEHGVAQGLYLKFHSNGHLKIAIMYDGGKIVEFCIYYHENGPISLFAEYRDGQIHGLLLELDEKGNYATLPRHYLKGELAKMAAYQEAAAKDPTLTPFEEDPENYKRLLSKYPDYAKTANRPASRPSDGK